MKGLKKGSGAARVAGESLLMAGRSMGNEKVRTALSLAGVCIGIFCIVASMTLFESLHRSLREGMESFGSEAVFIEKMPLEPDLDESGTFRWWNYLGRKEPSFEEFHYLKENCRCAAEMTFSAQFSEGRIIGVTSGWRSVVPNPLLSGRLFSPAELEHGAAVAVAGALVELEGDGSSVEAGGIRIPVIGRLKSGGINAIGIAGDADNAILVPYLKARSIASVEAGKSTITAFPAAGVSENELKEELSRLLRRYRWVPPGTDGGFAVNRMSFIAGEVNSIFSTLGTAGWIIGLFSLLVGGFGIANIMFVSVSERTREIGLQKALGAGRNTILLQYLTEAVFLSAAGAAAGTALAALLCAVIPVSVLELTVSARTAASAGVAAIILGALSGLAPALRASLLQPAVALVK